MAPFVCGDLNKLLKSLVKRFVKPAVTKDSLVQLRVRVRFRVRDMVRVRFRPSFTSLVGPGRPLAGPCFTHNQSNHDLTQHFTRKTTICVHSTLSQLKCSFPRPHDVSAKQMQLRFACVQEVSIHATQWTRANSVKMTMCTTRCYHTALY